MTQDSFVWVLGMVVGILGILTGAANLFSPEITKWLLIVSGVLTFVCTYLKQSPFPRKVWTDHERKVYRMSMK